MNERVREERGERREKRKVRIKMNKKINTNLLK